MSTPPDVVSQRELLNQLIIDRSTLEELGRVDVLWSYPPMHRVLGFICKSGFLGRKKAAFKLDQIDAIGSNGVFTLAQPEATDADKVNRLESFVGYEVWTDSGDKLGKIVDYLFNYRTGQITSYLFSTNEIYGIGGDVYKLPPHKILSFGQQRVLVPEKVVPRLKLVREGFQQKLFEVGELVLENVDEAKRELRSLSRLAQSATEQAKEQFSILKEQARERAVEVSQQAKARAEDWQSRHWANSENDEWDDDWISRGRMEQLPNAIYRDDDTVQTLTVEAEEVREDSEAPSVASQPAIDVDDWPDVWDDEPTASAPPSSEEPPLERQNAETSTSQPSPTIQPPATPAQPVVDDWDDDEPWI